MMSALLLSFACRPIPPATRPKTRVLLATWSDEPTELPAGHAFANAWSHGPRGRPALAALVTGMLPEHHGVRDAQLHGLAVPSLAERLEDEGRTSAAWFLGSTPLHPDETWGFGDAVDPDLLWIHGPAEQVLPAAEIWIASHPRGHAFLTSDGTEVHAAAPPVPLIWVGPGVEHLTPAPVGHTDVAATIAALFELAVEDLDGVDLRTGGSDVVVQEDARPALADGQSTLRIERRVGGISRQAGSTEVPVFDLAPPPWRYGSLTTDPFGVSHSSDLTQAQRRSQRLDAIRIHLERGELSRAARGVDTLERQHSSFATRLIRAELDARLGDPRGALTDRERVYAQTPSTVLAIELGHRWLDERSPERAAPWFDRALASWPDHPEALLGRLRCAHLLDQAHQDAYFARLVLVAPREARAFDAAISAELGYPISERISQELTEHPRDSYTTRTLARAHWNAGRSSEAVRIGTAGLTLHPRSTALRLDLATWCLELHDPARAARLLAPVARRFPDDLRVGLLFEAAKSDLAAERAEVEALRGSWRQ